MSAACGLCGDQLEHGGYLCPRHTLALAERLERLPLLFSEIGEHLVPRRTGLAEVTGQPGPCSPVNEDVIDLRQGGVVLVVESWRADVQRVRWPQHSPPPVEGGMDQRVRAACRWLGMELSWVAAHYPAAGDLAREVRELEGGMLAIVGAPPPRARHVGSCIAVTDDTGTVCGAALSSLPGQTLRCRQCGTAYRTQQDMLLLLHYQTRESA